jgi:hypothetical protein
LINLVHKIREILSAILVHPVTNNKLYFQDQNSGLPKEKTTNERERDIEGGREREIDGHGGVSIFQHKLYYTSQKCNITL